MIIFQLLLIIKESLRFIIYYWYIYWSKIIKLDWILIIFSLKMRHFRNKKSMTLKIFLYKKIKNILKFIINKFINYLFFIYNNIWKILDFICEIINKYWFEIISLLWISYIYARYWINVQQNIIDWSTLMFSTMLLLSKIILNMINKINFLDKLTKSRLLSIGIIICVYILLKDYFSTWTKKAKQGE